MKFVLSFAVVLFASVSSFAATVVCPNVGRITLNDATATIVYASAMEFSDVNDTANKVAESDSAVGYRASKWGASIIIPKALLNQTAYAADVWFYMPETAPVSQICTLE